VHIKSFTSFVKTQSNLKIFSLSPYPGIIFLIFGVTDFEISSIILGIKINPPTIIEISAEIKTAAADKSLIRCKLMQFNTSHKYSRPLQNIDVSNAHKPG
jgi:hypothetical protein